MSGSRSHSRRSEAAILIQTLERVLLFPALLLYLELVLHICKKNALAYAPVYLIFSISAGLFFACFTLPWRRRIPRL